LRRAIPQLIYYVFSAAIMHVYNMSIDPALAKTAKESLGKCMNALREMSAVWGAASRQLEVLLGLAAASRNEDLPPSFDPIQRGTKRAHESVPPSGATSPSRPGTFSPVNGASMAEGGLSDFTFNLDDLFHFPATAPASAMMDGGGTTPSNGQTDPAATPAAGAGPNPIFADLLDSFLAQGTGTSGFETQPLPFDGVLPSPTSVPPMLPSLSAPAPEGMPTIDDSTLDPDDLPSADTERWTTYLSSLSGAGLGGSAGSYGSPPAVSASAGQHTSDLPLFGLSPPSGGASGTYGFSSFH
jgi:hypothetical protein